MGYAVELALAGAGLGLGTGVAGDGLGLGVGGAVDGDGLGATGAGEGDAVLTSGRTFTANCAAVLMLPAGLCCSKWKCSSSSSSSSSKDKHISLCSEGGQVVGAAMCLQCCDGPSCAGFPLLRQPNIEEHVHCKSAGGGSLQHP